MIAWGKREIESLTEKKWVKKANKTEKAKNVKKQPYIQAGKGDNSVFWGEGRAVTQTCPKSQGVGRSREN